jgi:hypothetical protein
VIVDGSGAPWVFYRLWQFYAPPDHRYEVDLMAIRFTSAGTLAPGWNPDGVQVDLILTEATRSEFNPQYPVVWSAYDEQFASMGADSSMDVAWARSYNDPYNPFSDDHPLRRIRGSDGSLDWSLVTNCNNNAPAELQSDAHGGQFVAVGYANGSDVPEFQHVDSHGGAVNCFASTPMTSTAFYLGSVFSDGAGGFLALLTLRTVLRLQHVDSLGVVDPSYPDSGRVIARGVASVSKGSGIPNGSGGFVAVWADMRNGEPDLFISGSAPPASPVVSVPGFSGSRRIAVRAETMPSVGSGLAFAILLPEDGPAGLDVIDVAGRRVAHLWIADAAAGARSIRVDAGRVIAPGLYFVRLRQAGAEARTRILVRG